eukprot:gene209-825_t
MADMELVRVFNSELSSLYDSKPPISKAKMTNITKYAVKAVKYYKHVVHSVEKFVQKCRPEYKIPGLYVIDSIVRQSRHQFGRDKDLFGPRFAKNIKHTFTHFYSCSSDDKPKIVRVLNLWQKNGVYPPEIVQPLLDMASSGRAQHHSADFSTTPPEDLDDNDSGLKWGANPEYLLTLEKQRLEQESQIQQLKDQLEQQQQQKMMLQQQLQSGYTQPEPQTQYEAPSRQHHQQPLHPDNEMHHNQSINEQPQQRLAGKGGQESYGAAQFMQKFQEMVQSNTATQEQRKPQVRHVTGQHPLHADNKGKSPGFNQALLDAFDYGDDDNDEDRLAEHRRHLMEEETRLRKSLKESPEYGSKVAGILQQLQENVKMQKSQALREGEKYQPRSGIEDLHHTSRDESHGNGSTQLPFLGEHAPPKQNSNWTRGNFHTADNHDANRGGFRRIDEPSEGDLRRARDYPREQVHANRGGNDRYDYRYGMEGGAVDRDRRERGYRDWEGRDFREEEAKERERREREAREREAREREAREREAREREAREREAKEREAREREAKEREAREREREAKEKEIREAREREAKEKENRALLRGQREGRQRASRWNREDDKEPQVSIEQTVASNIQEVNQVVEQPGRKELSPEERWKLGYPDIKKGRLSLCSLTIWVGHLPQRTTAEQLRETFSEFGEVESIDLVQARGCSFIVMKKRREADVALQQLRNRRFMGHTIRMAWAPGKSIKGSDHKQFWDEEQGVTFIPWDRIRGTNLKDLLDGGVIDRDSLPPDMELEAEPDNSLATPAIQPMQLVPPNIMGAPPPHVMPIPPPGLIPFPPGFAPPMPGMPLPGMMPSFGMGMPPPPGMGIPPQGMPPGFVPPHPLFDPTQRHHRPGLLEPPPSSDPGDFGPNQPGPRAMWHDPSASFPGPRGPPRGFARPPFEERQPRMPQRMRLPVEPTQVNDPTRDTSRNTVVDKTQDVAKEFKPEAGKPVEKSVVVSEGLSGRTKETSEEADKGRKSEDNLSKEGSEPRAGDKRRDRGDRYRDRSKDYDRGRHRDHDSRGDRSRDRDRDRDRRRFSGRDRDRDFGRDRDRDGDRDRGRDRDYDRDRRHPDRDRYRSRDRSKDRNRSRDRSRDRDRSRGRDSDRSRDRDRDSDKERESDRSRRSSRDQEPGRSEKKTDDSLDEPDLKKVKNDVMESEKIETEDDKGGWKTLEKPSSDVSQTEKPEDTSTKPLLQQGFGFVGSQVKKGSSLQLAAKPSLFDDDNKPEKKIDMFSLDSDDEMKEVAKEEVKQEDGENTTIKKEEDQPDKPADDVHNELTEIFEEDLDKRNVVEGDVQLKEDMSGIEESITEVEGATRSDNVEDVQVTESHEINEEEVKNPNEASQYGTEALQDYSEKPSEENEEETSQEISERTLLPQDDAITTIVSSEAVCVSQDDAKDVETPQENTDDTGVPENVANATEVFQGIEGSPEMPVDATEAAQEVAECVEAAQEVLETTELLQESAESTEATREDFEVAEVVSEVAEAARASREDTGVTETPQDDAEMGEVPRENFQAAEIVQEGAESTEVSQEDAEEVEAIKEDVEATTVPQDETETAEVVQEDVLMTEAPKMDVESLDVSQQETEASQDDAELTGPSHDEAETTDVSQTEAVAPANRGKATRGRKRRRKRR